MQNREKREKRVVWHVNDAIWGKKKNNYQIRYGSLERGNTPRFTLSLPLMVIYNVKYIHTAQDCSNGCISESVLRIQLLILLK